jgi:flagellar biosynthesis/type III secretory pathway protein FliH
VARVIRSGATVIRRSVVDANAEAARVVAEARRQAERSREEAEAEAARIAERAKDLARAEAAAELIDAARARDALLTRAEGELLEIALAAAERIVEAHVALGEGAVAQLVRATLERARRARQATVLLHPDDAAALDGAALPPNVEVIADPALTRGDCVVRSELGTVDARVRTKLAALRAALVGAAR